MKHLLILVALLTQHSIAENLATSQSDSRLNNPKPVSSYCDQAKPNFKAPDCDIAAISKKGNWTKPDATKFTENCPQNCSDFEIVSREAWGHPNLNYQVCNEQETKDILRLAKLKKEERITYCAKGDAAKASAIADSIKAEVKKLKDGKEPGCMVPMDAPPTSITIHHSEGPSVNPDGTPTGPKDIMKVYIPNGWSDSPYHYLIAKDKFGMWQVFEGRSRLKGEKCKWLMGAHIGPGANDGSLGIVVIGNYNSEQVDPGGEQPLGPNPPPPGAVSKIIQLVAKLKHDCPSIKQVDGHGEARARAYGCVTNGHLNLKLGNCAEENKGAAGRAGCYKACPGEGCSTIPGDIHYRVVNGR